MDIGSNTSKRIKPPSSTRAAVASCAMAICWLTLTVSGCSRGTDVVHGPTNQRWRHSMNPIPARIQRDFLKQQTQLGSESEKAYPTFQRHLQQLAEYASRSRINLAAPPSIFENGFEAVCLQRKELQPSYSGERIRVARWQMTDRSPVYFEQAAVDQLVSCLIEPWKDAESFQIEFQIHHIDNKPTYFDVQVLAELSGRIDKSTGRSASALWEVRWDKNLTTTGEFRIQRIRMLGHEEILSYVANGRLFEDCTASILRHDPQLIASLGYSMDTWAKMIPGTDVLANNGLAVGDVNGDGLDDIYVCQPHGLPNLLLLQNHDGTADDVAVDFGVNILDHSYAALIVDLDNDLDQDLVVATDQALVLFSNTASGAFQLEHVLPIGHGTQSLSAADFDQDGDLDLFLCRYLGTEAFDDIFAEPNEPMAAENGGRNLLLRNDEAWRFVDVTQQAGLTTGNHCFSRSAVWSDFDADGDVDLYVANDFHHDQLYENDNGWLRNKSEGALKTHSGRHASVSVGEFNGDRKPDFFVASEVSLEAARCVHQYLRMGGRFSAEASGFAAKNCFWYKPTNQETLERFEFQPPIFSCQSCFSSAVADLNNDALDDILMTNGWLTRKGKANMDAILFQNLYRVPVEGRERDRPHLAIVQREISDLCRAGYSFSGFQRNRCFLSMGNGRFANYSAASGFDFLDDARAIATTDWDGDGNLDVIVNCRTSPRLRILRNSNRSRNRFLALDLVGTVSNRDAIGSRVELYVEGRNEPIVKSLVAGSGRASQSSKRLHFGLGTSDSIRKAIVYWPSGEIQEFTGLHTNKFYSIVEGQAEAAEKSYSRFQLAIQPQAIEQLHGFPNLKHSIFYPPSRLPILEFLGYESKWFPVEPLKDIPMVAMFCRLNDSSFKMLADWSQNYREVVDSRVDFVPLFYDDSLAADSLFLQVDGKLQESDFPFRWGVLSRGSRDKLKMIFGEWFFDQNLPSEPVTIMIDPRGNVVRGYHGDQSQWTVIQRDAIDVMESLNRFNGSTKPRNGLWISRFRTPQFDRIQSRFMSIGYEQDANRFATLAKIHRSEIYCKLAWDLASEGNLNHAADHARRSLDLNPNSVGSLIVAARIAQKQASVADSQQRIQLLREAGRQLEKSITLDPTNADAYLARAEVFRELNDVDHAVILLREFLKIDPANWEAYAAIGRLLIEQKEYVAASKYLIKAHENRPTLPLVADELGTLYLNGGQYQQAQQFLQQAHRLRPSDSNVTQRLGEAAFWVGNFAEAGEYFQQSLQIDPTEKQANYYLAWLLATSPIDSQRDGERALALIQTFYDLDGDSAIVNEIRAACLAEIGRFDEAQVLQEKALELVQTQRATYTLQQLEGLKSRIYLYLRSEPCRISNINQIPIPPPGAG